MAELILEMGHNLALYKGRPGELVEQKINARVMPPEAQERLTENIRKEKRLEQLPFAVVREDGTHELISGHHRKRGAEGAGLAEIFWLSDTRTDMTRSLVAAKQLAHNSLQGKDDPETVRDIYAQIDDCADMLESFVSAADFDSVEQLSAMEGVELNIDLDLRTMVLVFTPSVLAKLDRVEQFFKEHVPAETDLVGVCSSDILARVRQVMLNVAHVEDVRSMGAVFARMCEIVEAHFSEDTAKKALPSVAESAQ